MRNDELSLCPFGERYILIKGSGNRGCGRLREERGKNEAVPRCYPLAKGAAASARSIFDDYPRRISGPLPGTLFVASQLVCGCS